MIKVKNTTPSLSDDSVKQETGKTWDEWFKLLDQFGGPEKGRRAIGDYLYSELKVDPWWVATLNVEYEAARGIVKKDGRAQGYNICVTKTIAAPLNQAFAAFSTAGELDKWFSSNTKQDFSVGGRYENEDGDQGEFKKVRENKDLKFTWENERYTPGSVVEIKFQSKGEKKCGIIVTHDRIQKRDEADDLRAGWGVSLDVLKSYLENGAP